MSISILVDILVFLSIAISAFVCFKIGLIDCLQGKASYFMSAFISFYIARKTGPLLYFSLNAKVSEFVAIIICFVLSFIVLAILFNLLSKGLKNVIKSKETVDKVLGLILGIVVSFFFCCAVLTLLSSILNMSSIQENSIFYKYIVEKL